MRNRYIKAILIVLAATGVEAQMVQTALKAAGGGASVEEILSRAEIKAMRTDLLQVVNALKSIDSHNEKDGVYLSKSYALASPGILFCTGKSVFNNHIYCSGFRPSCPKHGGSIVIRAPSYLSFLS